MPRPNVKLDAKPTPAGHWLYEQARTLMASPHALAPDSSWMSGWVLGRWNQGDIGSCVGHGVEGGCETRYGLLHRVRLTERYSPGYPYARARMEEGTFPRDVGATVGDGVGVAHKWGLPRFSLLPYHEDAAQGPTPEADADAAIHRIPQPLVVPVNPQALKTAICAGMPVVFGMGVPARFFDTGSDGKVPELRNAGADEGGHCMYCVGYNSWGVMVANSWGEGWGDKGWCYMSWDSVQAKWWEAWALPLA